MQSQTCSPLKAQDTLLVKDMAAAEQYLLLEAKVLTAYTTLMMRILALSGLGLHA